MKRLLLSFTIITAIAAESSAFGVMEPETLWGFCRGIRNAATELITSKEKGNAFKALWHDHAFTNSEKAGNFATRSLVACTGLKVFIKCGYITAVGAAISVGGAFALISNTSSDKSADFIPALGIIGGVPMALMAVIPTVLSYKLTKRAFRAMPQQINAVQHAATASNSHAATPVTNNQPLQQQPIPAASTIQTPQQQAPKIHQRPTTMKPMTSTKKKSSFTRRNINE